MGDQLKIPLVVGISFLFLFFSYEISNFSGPSIFFLSTAFLTCFDFVRFIVSIGARPSPFFSLFSVVRPTQIFAFSKKKNYVEGNDTLFQTTVTLIRNIGNFLPYSFGRSSFLRCSRLNLTTTSIFPSSIAAMLTL